MADFQLDELDIRDRLQRARARAATADLDTVVGRVQAGLGLEPEDIAVLWFAPRMDTETIYALARLVHERRSEPLETFSPLYITNTCDAECRMCGMRRDNEALERETAGISEVEEQLRILSGRGMYAVALLTGEYRSERRRWALEYVNHALRVTKKLAFSHTLINMGSIDEPEFDTLLAGVARAADGSVKPKLTMCTFQESYSREHYRRFMGTEPENPRADFDRRLSNFDRSFRAGMRVANPGILVGLNPDVAFELAALVRHSQHLLALGMEVYVSVPRLRQIAGGRSQGGISDDDFVRLVAVLSLALPGCKIVLTTRESAAIQRKLVPIVAVLSAGSAAVAPYTRGGARFPLERSQFEVIDQRPFELILREYEGERSILNYRPPVEQSGATAVPELA
jgi:2-iminoacetate synthase